MYAFHDAGGRVQVWWSGRGAEAEEAVNRVLAGRSFAELDDAQRAAVGLAFDDSYRSELRRRNSLASPMGGLASLVNMMPMGRLLVRETRNTKDGIPPRGDG